VEGLILVGVLFLLEGGRKEKGREGKKKEKKKEKKKKNLHGEEGFPRCWTHLAGWAVSHSC
jgi:hypothetical protein